jgi:dephospho-CoA kinase
MRAIVITGGIGSGKSTAAEYFRSRGAVTVDLDEVAAGLLTPGTALLGRVEAEFGADVVLADGRLDRAALARAAFVSADATARLDAIVHPAVAREVAEMLARLRREPEPPAVVVLEVPLLAEAPTLAALGDVVLAIVAPEGVRIARTVARGMAEDEAQRRLSRQATDAERAALANAVIVNDRSIEEFRSALETFWDLNVEHGGDGR